MNKYKTIGRPAYYARLVASTFEVIKVRMADNLLQEGLLKKDKKAASFMTIGEPDVRDKRVRRWL